MSDRVEKTPASEEEKMMSPSEQVARMEASLRAILDMARAARLVTDGNNLGRIEQSAWYGLTGKPSGDGLPGLREPVECADDSDSQLRWRRHEATPVGARHYVSSDGRFEIVYDSGAEFEGKTRFWSLTEIVREGHRYADWHAVDRGWYRTLAGAKQAAEGCR